MAEFDQGGVEATDLGALPDPQTTPPVSKEAAAEESPFAEFSVRDDGQPIEYPGPHELTGAMAHLAAEAGWAVCPTCGFTFAVEDAEDGSSNG